MVIAVQTGRYIIRNGNGGLVAAATAAAGGFFRKGPYAVQRKVCGQLLLTGQNLAVLVLLVLPAYKGESAIHAVLRAGHTGRNLCNGVFAALNQRLLCRSGIAFRQVTGNIIRQRVHQRMRCLERNVLRVFFSRDILINIPVSRFRRPAADRLIATLSSIQLIPAVMIPAGNLQLVRGQNAVAAHVLCIRERKDRAAVEKQIVTCGRCGVVIHCALRRDIDVGRTRVNCAAVACCGVVVHCAVRRDVDVCIIIGVNCAAHVSYGIVIVHHSTGLKIHIDNRRAKLIGKDACTAGSSITADRAVFRRNAEGVSQCIGIDTAAVAGCRIGVNCRTVQQVNVRVAGTSTHSIDTCAALCLVFRNRNTVKFNRSCAVSYDCAALACAVVLQQLGFAESQIRGCADRYTAAHTVLRVENRIARDCGIGDKVIVLAGTAFFCVARRIVKKDTCALLCSIILKEGVCSVQFRMHQNHTAAAVRSGVSLNMAAVHGQRTVSNQNTAAVVPASRNAVFGHGDILHGYICMRRINTAAADFAIDIVADCFITRYGQIFELNNCAVDCEAAAILRIPAAGNRTVFHGNLRFITGNGHNRRICITRQRKPAEVERQRLIDGDILRNITEQNDGFAAVCCSNRGSNSRILVLADLCSVFRCFRFCRSFRFCRVLRFCRSLRCGCAASCSGVLTCRFYVLRRLTFLGICVLRRLAFRLRRFGVCVLRRLTFRLKRFGVCIPRRLTVRLRHRGICVRFILGGRLNLLLRCHFFLLRCIRCCKCERRHRQHHGCRQNAG